MIIVDAYEIVATEGLTRNWAYVLEISTIDVDGSVEVKVYTGLPYTKDFPRKVYPTSADRFRNL